MCIIAVFHIIVCYCYFISTLTKSIKCISELLPKKYASRLAQYTNIDWFATVANYVSCFWQLFTPWSYNHFLGHNNNDQFDPTFRTLGSFICQRFSTYLWCLPAPSNLPWPTSSSPLRLLAWRTTNLKDDASTYCIGVCNIMTLKPPVKSFESEIVFCLSLTYNLAKLTR